MELSPSRNPKCTLKLHLGEKGTRRIKFLKLWNEDSQTFSFDILVDLAFKHSNVTRTSLSSAIISYIDEDGDTITISSDEELVEAFEQFVDKEPPVVRAIASLNGDTVKKMSSFQMGKKFARNAGSSGRVVPLILDKKKRGQDIKRAKHLRLMDEILSLQNTEIAVLRRKDTLIQEMQSLKDQPICDVKENQEVEELKNEKMKEIPREGTTPASTSQEKSIHIPDSFDPNFIHGRHTCDGCFSTPIIGYRFNAVNRSDYDLCHVCYKNYKGDIRFLPEQLDRDVHLQQRWHNRQFRTLRRNMKKNQESVNPYQTLKEDMKETCLALVDEVQGFRHRASVESLHRSHDEESKTNVDNETSNCNEILSVGGNSYTSKTNSKYSCSDERTAATTERLSSNNDFGRTVLVEAHIESPDLTFDKESTKNSKSTMKPTETLTSGNGKQQVDSGITAGSDHDQIFSTATNANGFVSAEYDVKSNGDSSRDEWEVVNEKSDAMVAQATEMLGSALFKSFDNIAPSDVDEVDSPRYSLTIPANFNPISATTDDTKPVKGISPELLARWESFLCQLHSMGFVDDQANIDALERLKAADMGVNSNDEPRIEAVVTVLLNHIEEKTDKMRNI